MSEKDPCFLIFLGPSEKGKHTFFLGLIMYLGLKFWRQTGRPSCQPVWKATIGKFEVITYPIDSQKNNPKIAIKNSLSNLAESCRAKNCNVCQVYGVDLDLWVFICYWELTKVSKELKYVNFHSDCFFLFFFFFFLQELPLTLFAKLDNRLDNIWKFFDFFKNFQNSKFYLLYFDSLEKCTLEMSKQAWFWTRYSWDSPRIFRKNTYKLKFLCTEVYSACKVLRLILKVCIYHWWNRKWAWKGRVPGGVKFVSGITWLSW